MITRFVSEFVAAADEASLSRFLSRLLVPLRGPLPDSFWSALGLADIPDTLSSCAAPLIVLQTAAAETGFESALAAMTPRERAGVARSHSRDYWLTVLGGPARRVEARRQALLFVLFLGLGWSCVPNWRTATTTALARQIYASRDFSAMPILADALQDAGCDIDEWLSMMRARDTPWCCGAHVLDDLRS